MFATLTPAEHTGWVCLVFTYNLDKYLLVKKNAAIAKI